MTFTGSTQPCAVQGGVASQQGAAEVHSSICSTPYPAAPAGATSSCSNSISRHNKERKNRWLKGLFARTSNVLDEAEVAAAAAADGSEELCQHEGQDGLESTQLWGSHQTGAASHAPQQEQQQQQQQQQQLQRSNSTNGGARRRSSSGGWNIPGLRRSRSQAGQQASDAGGDDVGGMCFGPTVQVTPEEFEDIMTVIEALSVARRSLAIKLATPDDPIAARAAATAAAAAAAAATAARATSGSPILSALQPLLPNGEYVTTTLQQLKRSSPGPISAAATAAPAKKAAGDPAQQLAADSRYTAAASSSVNPLQALRSATAQHDAAVCGPRLSEGKAGQLRSTPDATGGNQLVAQQNQEASSSAGARPAPAAAAAPAPAAAAMDASLPLEIEVLLQDLLSPRDSTPHLLELCRSDFRQSGASAVSSSSTQPAHLTTKAQAHLVPKLDLSKVLRAHSMPENEVYLPGLLRHHFSRVSAVSTASAGRRASADAGAAPLLPRPKSASQPGAASAMPQHASVAAGAAADSAGGGVTLGRNGSSSSFLNSSSHGGASNLQRQPLKPPSSTWTTPDEATGPCSSLQQLQDQQQAPESRVPTSSATVTPRDLIQSAAQLSVGALRAAHQPLTPRTYLRDLQQTVSEMEAGLCALLNNQKLTPSAAAPLLSSFTNVLGAAHAVQQQQQQQQLTGGLQTQCKVACPQNQVGPPASAARAPQAGDDNAPRHKDARFARPASCSGNSVQSSNMRRTQDSDPSAQWTRHGTGEVRDAARASRGGVPGCDSSPCSDNDVSKRSSTSTILRCYNTLHPRQGSSECVLGDVAAQPSVGTRRYSNVESHYSTRPQPKHRHSSDIREDLVPGKGPSEVVWLQAPVNSSPATPFRHRPTEGRRNNDISLRAAYSLGEESSSSTSLRGRVPALSKQTSCGLPCGPAIAAAAVGSERSNDDGPWRWLGPDLDGQEPTAAAAAAAAAATGPPGSLMQQLMRAHPTSPQRPQQHAAATATPTAKHKIRPAPATAAAASRYTSDGGYIAGQARGALSYKQLINQQQKQAPQHKQQQRQKPLYKRHPGTSDTASRAAAGAAAVGQLELHQTPWATSSGLQGLSTGARPQGFACCGETEDLWKGREKMLKTFSSALERSRRVAQAYGIRTAPVPHCDDQLQLSPKRCPELLSSSRTQQGALRSGRVSPAGTTASLREAHTRTATAFKAREAPTHVFEARYAAMVQHSKAAAANRASQSHSKPVGSRPRMSRTTSHPVPAFQPSQQAGLRHQGSSSVAPPVPAGCLSSRNSSPSRSKLLSSPAARLDPQPTRARQLGRDVGQGAVLSDAPLGTHKGPLSATRQRPASAIDSAHYLAVFHADHPHGPQDNPDLDVMAAAAVGAGADFARSYSDSGVFTSSSGGSSRRSSSCQAHEEPVQFSSAASYSSEARRWHSSAQRTNGLLPDEGLWDHQSWQLALSRQELPPYAATTSYSRTQQACSSRTAGPSRAQSVDDLLPSRTRPRSSSSTQAGLLEQCLSRAAWSSSSAHAGMLEQCLRRASRSSSSAHAGLHEQCLSRASSATEHAQPNLRRPDASRRTTQGSGSLTHL